MHTQDDDNNIYNFSRKINEKNITFRKSNKSNDIKKKPHNPDDGVNNKKCDKTVVVEITGDSILNNIAQHGISQKIMI